MMSRRLAILVLSFMGMLDVLTPAWAEDVRVMQSTPAASAVIGGRSSEFLVRFDRPVDHVHSTLAITRDGKLVERLQPRLNSAPEVLFARAPTMPAGDYKLHWAVRTMTGVDVIQGDIPFTVKDQP
jgi:methionine-rich copper-binding protein CopC